MTRTVTITGGSGAVGQLLRPGLVRAGWEVRVFDRWRGPLVDVLRRHHLRRTEGALRATRVLRSAPDDILGGREALARAFAGSRAVIHLAAVPHPYTPGATEADFRRLNYDAGVDVFEAAREAGVATVVLASSAQVYAINHPVRIAQFPLLESNPLPLPAEGQTTYGFLKAALERYLDGACTTGTTQAVALRLEFPGSLSTRGINLYVSTTVENLVAAFVAAVDPPAGFGFAAVNVADATVDPDIVDIQAYLRRRWPFVPNHTTGNQGLLSIERARTLLGYRPVAGGTYITKS